MSLLRTLFWTSRPISWVNTAYPYGFAYLLSGGSWRDWVFWAGVVFFLVPYNLAMYGINDVFDHESDLLNPRKGGVEGALAERSSHRPTLGASALSCLPFLGMLLAAGGLWSGLALVVSMFAVVAYSAPPFRFKEVPFLDSITSATHFVGPAVVGALMLGESVPAAGWAALGAFVAWSMASHAFGSVQDIRADREAGIGSVGTVLGARGTVRVAVGLYLLAALLMLATPLPWTWLAVVPLVYVASIAPFAGLPDDRCEEAHAGWTRFLWLNYAAGAAVTITGIAQAS
ncbi:4-hydroxybenzoate polyprenyltransferase [Kytococcus aerolatus]|uniref:4-hydroxybenzoate polyprenyltransferase n=1 Tax=Kytococcus aerolatus TaxID=592308 RepID=A0A212T1F0_9MICO|nr:prenyltransferase [Kytococcus aerolatus]SNC59857.1 4-hydroxybenzoate polyprenyltransferase [Kytococcus aerolatus]